MALHVIGISAHYHDSACCLLSDGRLVAAVQEERFTRRKNTPHIPKSAFRYCLAEGGIQIDEVDCVAYYENPAKKFARQLASVLPRFGESGPLFRRLDPTRPLREIREMLGYEGPVEFVDHHASHAASAFFYSGLSDAAILTVDGVGELTTTSFGRGEGRDVTLLEEVHFPHSLGLLYSALTAYLGFEVNDGEYKVMGLAPYGRPRYREELREMIHSDAGAQYRLDTKYFDFLSEDRMYSDELPALLGQPPRKPDTEILPFHMDLASSLQSVCEEVLLEKVRYLRVIVPSENLCMAGGVALNCVANGRIRREGGFKRLFVQPAAGDAGGALGCAAIAHRRLSGERVATEPLRHAYFGPRYSSCEVANVLDGCACPALDYRGRESDLIQDVAARLERGRIVGWFHGRMEFGPRALGARSILADPRDSEMPARINAAVKFREHFRPFGPAVLEAAMSQHFDASEPTPFMIETARVTSALPLPAVTHVDGSARLQSVAPDTNPRFAALLAEFGRRTGCPILLNTSFNVRGEPIVCSPVDALMCFAATDIDTLVIEDFILDREDLPQMVRAAASFYRQHAPSSRPVHVYGLY
jgi:carbamoyltransferase